MNSTLITGSMKQTQTRNSLGYTVFTEEYLKKYLFGESWEPRKIFRGKVETAVQEMTNQGVEWSPEMDQVDLPDVEMPELLSDDINQHFNLMAQDLYGDVFKILKRYANAKLAPTPPPSVYLIKPGWHRYTLEDGEWKGEAVPHPLETIFELDFETFVQGSRFSHPIIGTAINENACYLWLHEAFCDPSISYRPQLVSIGTGKILVTWNGAYDAQRTLERYTLDSTVNTYIDGMSLHRLCRGIDDSQRTFIQMLKKKPWVPKPAWLLHNQGSMSSLLAAYNLLTGSNVSEAAKGTRNLFVKVKTMAELREHTEVCLEYAMTDVVWTHECFTKLWKMFVQRAPGKSVWATHFIIHDAIIPVTEGWHQWVKDTEAKYQEDMRKIDKMILALADKYYQLWLDGDIDVERDTFLRNLDWRHTEDTNSPYYEVPNWYKLRVQPGKRFNTNPKTETVTHLLRLRWKGQPLEYVKNKTKDEDGGWMIRGEEGELIKVEHKSGDDDNVGSVFNSFYLKAFERGVMTSDSPEAREIMELVNKNSYWTSIRSRCMEAHIERIEDPVTGRPINLMAPQIKPSATVTGRSSGNLWNTAASHLPNTKRSFEFKSQCAAPYGYKLAVFDFASQELRIGGLFSCAKAGLTGSSTYAHMLITGKKEDKTDMYSLEAAKVGVDRDTGKTVLLGTQYMGGKKTLSRKVYSKNPQWGIDETQKLVGKIITNFRGHCEYGSNTYEGGSASEAFNFMVSLVKSDHPCTPNLLTQMPPAIQPRWNGKGVMPSNVNFTIQATASSYGQLATTLVAIEWLRRKVGVWARYSISLHDEIVYLIREEDTEIFAMIYNVAHAWTWALLAHNLELVDLTPTFAWIDSVEIMNHWRKELGKKHDPTSDVFTPNFDGERSITLHELVDKKVDKLLISRLT